jgi:hypothetical protein
VLWLAGAKRRHILFPHNQHTWYPTDKFVYQKMWTLIAMLLSWYVDETRFRLEDQNHCDSCILWPIQFLNLVLGLHQIPSCTTMCLSLCYLCPQRSRLRPSSNINHIIGVLCDIGRPAVLETRRGLLLELFPNEPYPRCVANHQQLGRRDMNSGTIKC